MEKLLEVKKINKSFGANHIIKDVTFDAYAGEVFGYLGPNGAGKTTTIKMIMGFLTTDSGDIIINGHNMDTEYEAAMADLGGIVENPEMYKDFSGRMNIEMYARIHDNYSKERVDEVINLVGMQKRADDPVKKYSLGMKQRIGLAQALVNRPRVLILDEPTNGLDPSGIKELRDILKYIAHKENAAVIISSHQLAEMELMCDRIGILSKGELIKVMTLDEIHDSAQPSYVLTPLEIEKAVNALNENGYGDIVKVAENRITVFADDEKIVEVLTSLMRSEVLLIGITKNEKSLEAAFIDTVKGGI